MSDTALGSYLDKWLAVQPQQRIALGFVDPSVRDGHVALAAFEQEIIAAAYGIREPQVAAVKLNWWAEELAGAPASGGRHPLSKLLFAQDVARTIPVNVWLAPVLAAMGQLEEGTSADFAAQVAATGQLHHALAALETRWWFGAGADPSRAAMVATHAHLLNALMRLDEDVERERLPLPMARLARFGLTRLQLRKDSPARRDAIRAQLDDLARGFSAAAQAGAPLSVFRAVELHDAHGLARRALRAPEPLKVLQDRPVSGFRVVWQAWRAARAWRRQVH